MIPALVTAAKVTGLVLGIWVATSFALLGLWIAAVEACASLDDDGLGDAD